MAFRSLYHQGFFRVAACTVHGAPADPARNTAAIQAVARACHEEGVGLAVFPELCISGYAIDDLLLQDVVLDAVEDGLRALCAASETLLPLLLVGAPLRHAGRLYNCAVAIGRGRILGVVPKVHLPNYREFYERRHFASGERAPGPAISLLGEAVPFGTDLVFVASDMRDCVIHAEVCEDLWVPVPPSALGALAGATVLANLSASNITIGKADTRRMLCQSQSARCLAAYVYAAAGSGESTTDLAWDGQTAIFENGIVLAESKRFHDGAQYTISDIDLALLRQERARQGTFDDNRAAHATAFRRVPFRIDPPDGDLGLRRAIPRFPFVPADPALLARDCYEAYEIQVAGLKQRLRATGTERMVIGVSGGLDSTQALLVAARACDQLGLGRDAILAYTMPGFATGDASRSRALELMGALRVRAETLDIVPTARMMLETLGHPAALGTPDYDITYENVQAGLRTDYLFRLANQHGGIVLGTGDLSELALGWCTYGVGDQMSHYNVNSGVPKTLIQHLIRWVERHGDLPEARAALEKILTADISPELVPASADGVVQSSEAAIGPYELQDFTLYYVLRHGFGPGRIAFLALHAWSDPDVGAWPPGFPVAQRRGYTLDEIRRWMAVFLQRFFGFAQFKRSALPNGPKLAAGGSLSPRGDWRAPSDGAAAAWLAALDKELI
jgi:NAD+ synthase (glutamine-hydrolysing)